MTRQRRRQQRRQLERSLRGTDPLVIVSEHETVFFIPRIGGLIISSVEGVTIVEAVAINDGEPRHVVLARHDELERSARAIFGDQLEMRDPLGLRSGAPAVVS